MSSFIDSIKESLSALSNSPLTMLAMGILFALVMAVILFKRVTLTTRTMTLVGVTVAISFILNLIVLFKMPQGGSVTLGSMIPILILAFVYGPELGMLAGFIFGLISLISNAYILHPIQVLFDYPLPFMMLGLAGIFKLNNNMKLSKSKKIILGLTLAILGRLLFHWLSGVIFFSEYAVGMPPALYSLTYNGSYLLAEFLISLPILLLLPIDKIFKDFSKL